MQEERYLRLTPCAAAERLVPVPKSFGEEERDGRSPTTFEEGERWKRPSPSEEEERPQPQPQDSSGEGEQLPRLARLMTAEGELLSFRPRRCEGEGRRPSGRVQREVK